jgi:hypothetical protein
LLKTRKEIKEYLDNAIRSWRGRKDASKEEEEILIASCYVDAFQSVRVSIFDELLPKE